MDLVTVGSNGPDESRHDVHLRQTVPGSDEHLPIEVTKDQPQQSGRDRRLKPKHDPLPAGTPGPLAGFPMALRSVGDRG